MTDPNLIGDLIRAGVDADLVSRVAAALVDVAFRRQSADSFVDVQAEKRRAADRERQRIRRQSADNPQTPQMSQNTPLLIEDNSKDLSKKKRGSRLSADWAPSEDDLAFARSKGMPQIRMDLETEKFRNYWTAKTGTAATKIDWPATWRNWVLSSIERSPVPPPLAIAPSRRDGPPMPPSPDLPSHEELLKKYAQRPAIEERAGVRGEGPRILPNDGRPEGGKAGHQAWNGGMVELGTVLRGPPGVHAHRDEVGRVGQEPGDDRPGPMARMV